MVSLEEMLLAKENRAINQKELIEKFNNPIISFTLNIPGPIKTSDDIYLAFVEGKNRIDNKLDKTKISVLETKIINEKTGFEYYLSVSEKPLKLKELMIEIEEEDKVGRLFDIDVIDVNQKIISRTDLNAPSRKCLLCEKKSHECSRNRTHSVDELVAEINRIINTYLN